MSDIETEVTRVLNNPDHVILSDTLKDLLGNDETDQNFDNISVSVQSADFNVTGDLLVLEIFETSAEISLSVPIFKALSSIFNLKGEAVEGSFQNFEHTVKGKMRSIAVETRMPENSSNVNLRFYLKFPK